MAIATERQHPVEQLVPPPPPPPPPLFAPVYKHHCKVCNKGFACGRALGGHMRAHGITDDGLDDDASDSSSEAASPTAATTKRMYALRTNPGRLKSCRVCENCGKEFTSWKSLLDHGKCNYNHGVGADDGWKGSPPLRYPDDDGGEVEDVALASSGWSKGKRTRRAKAMALLGNGSGTEATSPSREEEDLANFLVMLSSSGAACSSSRFVQPPVVVVDADQESSRDSESKGVERNTRLLAPQPISMMMAPAVPELKLLPPPQVLTQPATVPRGLFECKGCKKVFTSHQALGGHRASHKKVKGCFAAKLDSNRSGTEPSQPVVATHGGNIKVATNAAAYVGTNAKSTADANPINTSTGAPAPSANTPAKKKGKVHECSICHRVFSSGQALGGHKRCHCLTTGPSGELTGTLAKLHHHFVAQDHAKLTLGLPMFDVPANPTILDLDVPTKNSSTTADPIARKRTVELNDSVLCLNAPASMYNVQSWTVHSNTSNVNKMTATSSRNDVAADAVGTDDEADSRNAKRGKIRDLGNMNVAGETSHWLQVGVGLPPEIKEKSIEE